MKSTENSLETAGRFADPVSSVTERKERSEQVTMMAQKHVGVDLIELRTVPVNLKNGNRSLTVIALLDVTSTETYINADVAAELGLKGKTEKVTVNVLNGHVETFETRPVDLELQSLNGNVSIKVLAFTANSMSVVD